MSSIGSATHCANPPPAANATARELIDAQLPMLTRLAEIGMEIAEAAGRRAVAQAEGATAEERGSDPALAYARAARAVRLTLALQSRLVAELAALDQAQAKARAVEAGRRRDRVHARVEQAIEAERADADHDEIEHLSSAAWERLTETDDAELLDLPMDEVVALICRDLGLSPGWAEAFAEGGLAGAEHLPPPAAPSGRATSPALAGEARSGSRLHRFGGGAVAPDLSGVTEGASPSDRVAAPP
jgi:hypothetical protein